MGKTEALEKIEKQLLDYGKRVKALEPAMIYAKAPEIMFTEAAVARLIYLCEDSELSALVENGGTLEGCVKSIISYCMKDIGNSGDISEDEFRACIKDYYRMPDRAAEPTKAAHRPTHSTGATTKTQTASTGATAVATKPARHTEPTMLSTQLDLFGMMEAKDGG